MGGWEEWRNCKAQAVVARTYADYIATHYTRHGEKGTLCSDQHCQAFDPTYTNEIAIKAALCTTSGVQEYVGEVKAHRNRNHWFYWDWAER